VRPLYVSHSPESRCFVGCDPLFGFGIDIYGIIVAMVTIEVLLIYSAGRPVTLVNGMQYLTAQSSRSIWRLPRDNITCLSEKRIGAFKSLTDSFAGEWNHFETHGQKAEVQVCNRLCRSLKSTTDSMKISYAPCDSQFWKRIGRHRSCLLIILADTFLLDS
jgi:hypothetical protein